LTARSYSRGVTFEQRVASENDGPASIRYTPALAGGGGVAAAHEGPAKVGRAGGQQAQRAAVLPRAPIELEQDGRGG
jgi:hypothetical protein